MTKIKVCQGHACKSSGQWILERAKVEAKDKSHLSVEGCLCVGQCVKGPNVVIEKDGKREILHRMDPIKISKIIKNEKK